jgi:hypothetical protein
METSVHSVDYRPIRQLPDKSREQRRPFPIGVAFHVGRDRISSYSSTSLSRQLLSDAAMPDLQLNFVFSFVELVDMVRLGEKAVSDIGVLRLK